MLDHPRLTRLKGDFHVRESVDAAVRGQDAVLVTASATSLNAFKANPTYFSRGTGYAVDAMKAHGVRLTAAEVDTWLGHAVQLGG